MTLLIYMCLSWLTEILINTYLFSKSIYFNIIVSCFSGILLYIIVIIYYISRMWNSWMNSLSQMKIHLLPYLFIFLICWCFSASYILGWHLFYYSRALYSFLRKYQIIAYFNFPFHRGYPACLRLTSSRYSSFNVSAHCSSPTASAWRHHAPFPNNTQEKATLTIQTEV